ncbi:MAG: DUF309 domain-containing protein [Nitrososphaerota archaeon]|nr:DUF309 domain-containing protein [Candidatus Calditenuis fumarioli]
MASPARRFIVALRNWGVDPSQHNELLKEVRELLRGISEQVIDVRIGPRRLEVDLMAVDVEAVRRRLSTLSEVEYAVQVGEKSAGSIAEAVREAVELIGQNRYWEAHEVLEGVWRTAQGREKAALNGLILFAAAHVKLQRGDETGYRRVLRRALRALETSGLEELAGLDLRRLADAIAAALESPVAQQITIDSFWWKGP